MTTIFHPNPTDPVDEAKWYPENDEDYDDYEPRRVCVECGEPLEDDNWSDYCDECLKEVLKEF